MLKQQELRKRRSWLYPLRFLKRIDWILLLIIMVLMLGSIITLKSSAGSDGIITRQLLRFLAGFMVFFTILALPVKQLRRFTPLLYILTISLLFLVLFVGTDAGGARRWLNLGFMRLQPSEIAKLTVPMMVAWYLSRLEQAPNFIQVLISLLIIAIPFYAIVVEPDLGTSLLVGVSGVIALFLAGLPIWMMASGGVLVAIALPLFWQFGIKDYQRERVLTLFNPEADPWGAGYHIIQSKIAIGSGGLEGKGFMQGTQSQLEFLPESSTDFIFAVIAEEHGLIGVSLLLLLYGLLVLRGLYLGTKLTDRFARITVGTIFFTFFLNVFVNIGMVSGILPVVGLPLALISYGGSSVLSIMAGFALAMSLVHWYQYRQVQEYL
ncbi:MAG: rod shape-determining protein RodA [Cardiobacteriales bacterium]|nr:MAG: rod shape-determining protein RodA [Cardiobacteriales bacterium]